MMSERFQPRVLLAAMAYCLVLAACHSVPTRIYSLYAVPPAAPNAVYAGPAVRVDKVTVPPALDRLEVLTDVAPGELKISELDHWSAPLGQMAKNTLSADLLARLPRGRVIFPHLPKPDGGIGLSVDILDFQSAAGQASLEASWAYTGDSAGSAPPASARFTVPARDATARTTAQSLSALLGQLADRMVVGLPAGNAPQAAPRP